jgi:hypothetical protein
LLIALLLLAAPGFAPLHAQDIASGGSGPATSRVDISGMYSYMKPFDNSGINSIFFPTYPAGAVGDVAFFFKPHLGIQLEGSYFPQSSDDHDCVYTGQAGLIYRWQKRRFIPFVHAVGGGAVVGGPAQQVCGTWGYGGTGGGGLDYVLPGFHNHLALRGQADVNYSHVIDTIPAGVSPSNKSFGGEADLLGVRLSGGFTVRFGDMHSAGQSVPMLSCSADPGDPFAGDPVTVSSTISNLKSAKDIQYVWDSSAGKLAPSGALATVDTHGLAPGSYTVSGHLVQGTRKREIASCTASFTIRVIEPPTVACSADRAAINSGDPVAISARAVSPQNRPLTYNYTTTGGTIIGNGPTAALATIGAKPGNITVTCAVADDRNQSATASASITVATPAPPPPAVVAAAHAQPLCSISFDRDRKRPNRVNNESKACLDDVALSLARSTDSKLLLIGNHAPGESNQNAAERAMNAAQYLTDEKGIDGSRLDLRLGAEGTRSVSTMLVPAGATVDIGTTTSFDTSSVHRTGQAYGHATTPVPAIHRRVRRKKPVNAVPPL